MRGFLAFAAGLGLVVCTVAPSFSAQTRQSVEAQRALALLNAPCGAGAAQVAQASALASDTPTPEPTPTVPPPIIPAGPGTLVPPPLPGASPAITAPPPPTATPTVSPTPAPFLVAPVTPSPVPTPTPRITSGPLFPAASTGAPAVTVATPAAAPRPAETLGPNDYAILGDKLTGNRGAGPWDLVGDVNLLYADGVLVGDKAHYDGERYIDVTGNTYLRNRAGDTTLAADSIRFDTRTQRATTINGRGVTSQGVQQGLLHYSARTLVTERDGRTHGNRASMSTCENQHGGYHIEAKTLDITPGDRAVARAAVLFLGPLAVLYLPVLIIPLRHDPEAQRRNQGFVPVVGYSQAEGYYVKARIGFSPSNTYFGYYRVEGYTKIGFGLGYVATISRKDGRRVTNVDFFTLKNRVDMSQNTNLSINDQEILSRTLRGTARFTYQGDYGPLLSLPPSLAVQLGLSNTTPRDTENFSFNRQSSGTSIVTNNYGYSNTHVLSPVLTNAATVSFTTNSNGSSANGQLHFNTDTHLTSKGLDYDLIVDRTNATESSSVSKLPELLVRPHGSLFPRMRGLPTNATFTLGEYTDPSVPLATQRGEAQVTFGPALARLPIGDLNASVQVRQDYYGTGDLKAQVQQTINLTTPLGAHATTTLSYANQHVNGLGNEPFTFDTIGGASKNLQEVLKVYSGDVYTLTLQTGTLFNMMAEPVSYQLLTRPLRNAALILGGNWTPGAGNGFDRTNVQLSFPWGRGADIQYQSFVDWKARGRLEDKTIYLRKIIADCYEVRVSYNQDLKTVNVSVDLLAFPSQAINFGLGQQTSIIPQSFASDSFFGR